MLNQMCHIVLSLTDIGAIRQARGFKKNEVASRTTFESFFLSSIGLETVMASLSPEEVATLRLLVQQDEEVDITFFERLYGSAKKAEGYYYGTYTQRYKGTLDAVKKGVTPLYSRKPSRPTPRCAGRRLTSSAACFLGFSACSQSVFPTLSANWASLS